MEQRKRDALIELLKTALIMALFGGLAWLLWGCADASEEPVQVGQVLLVYLAGDNNLSGESQDKLDAIARGYHGEPSTSVLIYRDGRDGVPCLYEADGKGTHILIEAFEEENSAHPAVFARVIAQAKGMYPQAVFNLLVFSHATGWLPAGSYANPGAAVGSEAAAGSRSVLMDGTDEMALADFAAAIPDGAFGCIVFEACFMAGIEVAWELRHKANYIAASSAEIVSPGFTPVYEQHIGKLVTGDSGTGTGEETGAGNLRAFMQAVFETFDTQTGYMHSATLSIIKTEKLEVLADFVKQHCDFSKPVTASEVQHFDRGTRYLFCDMENYYSRLLDTEAHVAQLQQLMNDCVVWKAATPYFMEGYNGFSIRTHSGLTSYIPQERYPALNESYTAQGWYKIVEN